jgi:hypothetical protein
MILVIAAENLGGSPLGTCSERKMKYVHPFPEGIGLGYGIQNKNDLLSLKRTKKGPEHIIRSLYC